MALSSFLSLGQDFMFWSCCYWTPSCGWEHGAAGMLHHRTQLDWGKSDYFSPLFWRVGVPSPHWRPLLMGNHWPSFTSRWMGGFTILSRTWEFWKRFLYRWLLKSCIRFSGWRWNSATRCCVALRWFGLDFAIGWFSMSKRWAGFEQEDKYGQHGLAYLCWK